MKRHEKPYGCTFLTCKKVFGSKNDWKRHENSQHFHLEIWRCAETKPDEPACTKVCYRRMTFQEHLRKDHHISDETIIQTKTDECKIGRNCQSRFWCGFCGKSVDLKRKGLEAWTERFDHIDDHFMGRGGVPKQSITEWIPVDSDKPKGDTGIAESIFGELSSSSSSSSSPEKEKESSGSEISGNASPSGLDSDDNAVRGSNAGESSANARNLDESNPSPSSGGNLGSKRRIGTSSSSSDQGNGESSRNGRASKRAKTSGSFENFIICVSKILSCPVFEESLVLGLMADVIWLG